MAIHHLTAKEVGLPEFEPGDADNGAIFSLPSHVRAREALDFGLSMQRHGFNIFVVASDNSGRMRATLNFLNENLTGEPPGDWVYLNNFRHGNRPRPFKLAAGQGRLLRNTMAALIPRVKETLQQLFASEGFQTRVKVETDKLNSEIGERLENLRKTAAERGLKLVQSQQGGFGFVPAAADDEDAMANLTDEQRADLQAAHAEMTGALADVNRWRVERQSAYLEWLRGFERSAAGQALTGLIDEVEQRFSAGQGLARWFAEMRQDLLDNLDAFKPEQTRQGVPVATPDLRYSVNLIVDNSDLKAPPVHLEGNPTYENLFGRIEYRQIQGALQTDFSLIRGGALHKANGGVLVLRAEALARDARVWLALKGALRDGLIQIEEFHRTGGVPIANAPRPKPIALDVKVVIVGSPHWYYTFFSADPDFQSYFKVKADIDGDLDAKPDCVSAFAGLLRRHAKEELDATITRDGMVKLLGFASRWAGHRTRLTSRFELFDDLMAEAAALADDREIDAKAVLAARDARHRRNARIEDRLQEGIEEQSVLIDTTGSVVGQINALTVRDMGDHAFGLPSRVTARSAVGRHGVVNIEREVAMGGPIQQKGAMVLQGFLMGRFARGFPLSFTCSITFEQNYGGVEGDSASMAELLAVLSDLAEVPLRQDLAITGSVNQRGDAQTIGGAYHKVEGFFRTCSSGNGGLTGNQGVAVPRTNAINLVLEDDVAEAVSLGEFHLYAIDRVEDAVKLFTGMPAGTADDSGKFPRGTLFGLVQDRLQAFDAALTERGPL
ncbi:MAG: AAA family ATPase [Pseudomonadota bacterium]